MTEQTTPWSTSDLRALAAAVIRDKGMRAGDDADHYHLSNVARWDFPENAEPTVTELETAREYVREAVIVVDGVRFNDVDRDGTEPEAEREP